jgi:S-adenosylhomocysteine hydrolase
MKAGGPGDNEDGVLIEFQRVGATVKVTAIDPITLVEATIVGPASAGEAALKKAALDKLRYVLNRRGRE